MRRPTPRSFALKGTGIGTRLHMDPLQFLSRRRTNLHPSCAARFRVERSLIGKPSIYMTLQQSQRTISQLPSPEVSAYARYLPRHCYEREFRLGLFNSPARGAPVLSKTDQITGNLRRSGGDRHRERAPVPRTPGADPGVCAVGWRTESVGRSWSGSQLHF